MEPARVHAALPQEGLRPLIRCSHLRAGDTVCILDCGGGTVDTTLHSCKQAGGTVLLAEAAHADGALCGAMYVDQHFL